MYEDYQTLQVLRLHSLGYSDHFEGGSGRTAEEWVSTPSPTSVSMLAGDSLSVQVRSVHDGTTPKDDAEVDGRWLGIRVYQGSGVGSTCSLIEAEQLILCR